MTGLNVEMHERQKDKKAKIFSFFFILTLLSDDIDCSPKFKVKQTMAHTLFYISDRCL